MDERSSDKTGAGQEKCIAPLDRGREGEARDPDRRDRRVDKSCARHSRDGEAAHRPRHLVVSRSGEAREYHRRGGGKHERDGGES